MPVVRITRDVDLQQILSQGQRVEMTRVPCVGEKIQIESEQSRRHRQGTRETYIVVEVIQVVARSH